VKMGALARPGRGGGEEWPREGQRQIKRSSSVSRVVVFRSGSARGPKEEGRAAQQNGLSSRRSINYSIERHEFDLL